MTRGDVLRSAIAFALRRARKIVRGLKDGCHSACNFDPSAGGSASKIDPLNVDLLRCSL
jgi:hypothetical protein